MLHIDVNKKLKPDHIIIVITTITWTSTTPPCAMDRENWAALKDTIRQLYIDQNLNCKEVAKILREQHDDRVR